MTITDLIDQLVHLQRLHGDIDIAIMLPKTDGSFECAFDVDPFAFRIVDPVADESSYDCVALTTSHIKTQFHFRRYNYGSV